ncbi:MAG: putative baseplate assembly protein [Clostridia bacterium]|nr:putative baseplate assembly protein [Clostridia bacterium]
MEDYPTIYKLTAKEIEERLERLTKDRIPEWVPSKDGNDAGQMLHKIFARLMEIAIQRYNRVPDKNRTAFLDIMGISPIPPFPAGVPLVFKPVKGSGAVLVPRGTKAETKPDSKKTSLVYETQEDLTVVPVSNQRIFVVDPVWDRYTEQGLDNGTIYDGLNPFFGQSEMEHTLYIGSDKMFDFTNASIYLDFQVDDKVLPQWFKPGSNGKIGFHTFVTRLVMGSNWCYRETEGETDIRDWRISGGHTVQFACEKGIPETEIRVTYQDGEQAQYIKNRWLCTKVQLPLSILKNKNSITFKKIQIIIEGKQVKPEFCFNNGDRVNVSKEFKPFGDVPSIGDTFYIGSKEVFSKPLDTLKLHLDLKKYAYDPQKGISPQLEFEYFGKNGWEKLEIEEDKTNHFTQGDTVSFKNILGKSFVETFVHGEKSCWLRVSLKSGDYGLPFELVKDAKSNTLTVKENTGKVYPPIVRSITLSYTAKGEPDRIFSQYGPFCKEMQTTGIAPFLPSVEYTGDAVPSLYLGFDTSQLEQPLSLYFSVAPQMYRKGEREWNEGQSFMQDTSLKLAWQYFDGYKWKDMNIIDGTNNLTESGPVVFLIPADIKRINKFDAVSRYYVRVRLLSQMDAIKAQRIQGIYFNAVPALNMESILEECLGSSSGTEGQQFSVSRTPVLLGQSIMVREFEVPLDEEVRALREGDDTPLQETLVNPATGEKEIWVRWQEVPNFLCSGPGSRHYTLDREKGMVAFGDGKKGLIPPKAINGIKISYATGGGLIGNVSPLEISKIRSSLPGIEAVENPVGADGGSDFEKISAVKLRGPQTLKNRNDAVSKTDMEWIVKEALGGRIARIQCLSNLNAQLETENGWVTLILVPQCEGMKPFPSSELIKHVKDYLGKRCFTLLQKMSPFRINVIGPGYIKVGVELEVIPEDIKEAQAVKQRVVQAVSSFFHPLTGGPDGVGWSFGRNVYGTEICRMIENVPGVDHINYDRLTIKPNLYQYHLGFSYPTVLRNSLTKGTRVQSLDEKKSLCLAETVWAGNPVETLPVKGFQEGDRIFFGVNLTIDKVIKETDGEGKERIRIEITDEFKKIDFLSFPGGSMIIGENTEFAMNLISAVKEDQGNALLVSYDDFIYDELKKRMDDEAFSEQKYALLHPFPMTVKSVIGVENYVDIEVQPLKFRTNFYHDDYLQGAVIVSTLDNRIRMPLAQKIGIDEEITSIRVLNFSPEDFIKIEGTSDIYELGEVRPIQDIAYLDDNYLVYSGDHYVRVSDKDTVL